MNKAIQSMKNLLELSWTYSALCILGVLFFPEYVAPFLAIASLIFAYRDAKMRKAAFKVNTSGKLIWFFIIVVFISIFYSQHRFSTLSTLLMWIIMFCVYVSLTTVLTGKRRLFQFLVMLSIVFGIIGLISILEYLGYSIFHFHYRFLQLWGFIDEQVYYFYPGEMHLYNKDLRTASAFTNPNIFAEVMLFITPFALCAVAKSKQKYLRIITNCGFILGVIGFTFAFSRASYICLIAIGVAFFAFNPMRLNKRKYLSLLTLCGVILVGLILVPNVYADRMATLQPEEHSVSERIAILNVSLEAILEHPIFGYGAGIQNTTQVFTSAGLPKTIPHAHNLFLQLVLENGVLGLCVFLIAPIRSFLNSTLITIKTNAYRCYSFACMCSMAMFFLFGIVEYPLLCPKLVGTFYIMLAISDATERFSPDLTTIVTWKENK